MLVSRAEQPARLQLGRAEPPERPLPWRARQHFTAHVVQSPPPLPQLAADLQRRSSMRKQQAASPLKPLLAVKREELSRAPYLESVRA